jgi:hypothetical protein
LGNIQPALTLDALVIAAGYDVLVPTEEVGPPTEEVGLIYPAQVRTRKSLAEIIRKLSVT